ncbi:flagellar protein FlaG [Serpentinicella sp. ANB-PHB4]|uniref:flagellar protein FlaG n=1 Tax=Serpentinicella sp. ANB-PHB4 TaxID=3074076 RepID=UPI002865D2EC|nr:flagellar protein FlaG [Serpentinicella sp. ANB-PHB4]MDR5659794.1 flagellar protein FlaG [Serpentinicella sp. ANB-PHB4]
MRVEGHTSQVYATNSATGQGRREVETKISEMNQVENTRKEREISEEELTKAIEKANKGFEPFGRQFERAVHEDTNRVMVKVIDASTEEVIREIPPEKVLDMVAYMLEFAGILVDERI